ncbi:hypothetical protein ACFORH_14045 [Amycolatopsis roodepoortensis]|uniref:Uncharacterized protein n=1 Tax=Amycolatopsis roodepoortensis TaxID=700274 RepID=A0ABR9KYL6_9PSEU|nr:hypothetical protein [Amycolatopsis roodepoortensis]MBE1573466.1 hypothetical protein [Amycolatopsis roodepoortensis]
MKRILSFILGAVVLVVLAPAATASDATYVKFTPQPVLAPKVPETKPGEPVKFDQEVKKLGSVELKMSATQTAYVRSVMRANSATYRSLFDNEVRCTWPGGEQSFVTGQNILQKGASLEPDKEDVQLTTRFLVHPGVDTKVTCTAYVRAATMRKELDARFQLHDGFLEFADTSVANTAAGLPAQRATPRGLVRVGPDPEVVAREPALPYFTLAPGFTKLSVFADTEYKTCYPVKDKDCSKPPASTATFTLFVNQWNGDKLCQTSNATTTTRRMSYSVHHHYVPLHLPDFPVRADCEQRFNAYVLVKWQDGMDGGVQGTAVGLTDSRGSTTTHNADMSHVFVVPVKS